MQTIKNITIGSDIEVFLKDKKTGKMISAVGKIPGSKENPHYIDDLGHAIETDNVAVEFLIPPVRRREDFIFHINFMKDFIKDFIPKELELCIAPSAFFEADELNSDQAQTMGCDRDYNPYTMDYNPRPKGNKTNLRTTGTHIHIGYDDPDPILNMKLIKAFDLFLGLPSIILDTDTNRRKLYGKAGSCRMKPYGVEARILSSYFIGSNSLMEWVYDSTMAAIDFVNNNPKHIYDRSVEDIINTAKIEEAYKQLEKYNITLPEIKVEV